ncbi:MAG TPA: 3-dehydroquinate synthase [Nitrolancea sp.]|nr:3-dehydroquinate synthase [Nitrolancea sp.]
MKRVILIGLSGTGKSSVARVLATRLGFDAVDLDDEIVRIFGNEISSIFQQYGEPVFRAAERQQLAKVRVRSNVVIATGGGAPVDEANWVAMRPESLIIHLQAPAKEIIERLRGQISTDSGAVRPLLASDDPLASIERLWRERHTFYGRADATIETAGKTIDAVAREAETLVRAAQAGELPIPIGTLGVPTGRSDLYVRAGLLPATGRLMRQRFPAARRAWIISDSNVAPLWAENVRASIAMADFATELLVVPAGEASKSLEQTGALLDQLLDGRIDRRDVVVALGGGVVGDLAGFVAAIVLRGVGLVQIPTSLLAMVDSSVGGKTGIDHPRGKNLIGAFYQPQLVLADPTVLTTLPEREWRAGWAEIIKHGMIEATATGSEELRLLPRIEQASDADLRNVDLMATIVADNVWIKRSVVQGDEREAGLRRVLNYGHTLGHAMEASNYRYVHGEAIALGMRAAIALAIRLGRSTEEIAQRQNALLDRLGLPDRFDGELADVLEHLWSDKKAVSGVLTWILPGDRAGNVEVVNNVPLAEVEAVARAIGAR